MIDINSDNFEFLVFAGNLDPSHESMEDWPEEERSFIYDIKTMDGRTISVAVKGVKGEDYLTLERQVRSRAYAETLEGLVNGRWRSLLSEPH